MDPPTDVLSKVLKDFTSDGVYINGYVSTEGEIENIIEVLKRLTSTSYGTRDSASLQVDPNQPRIKENLGKRHLRYSQSTSPVVNYDGVLYMQGGKKMLECQFGPNRRRTRITNKGPYAEATSEGEREVGETLGLSGERRSNQETDSEFTVNPDDGSLITHDYLHTLMNVQLKKKDECVRITKKRKSRGSSKHGCEARVTAIQICRFVDYVVTSQTCMGIAKVQLKERLLDDFARGKRVRVENRYYLSLPLPNAHSMHPSESQSTLKPKEVDRKKKVSTSKAGKNKQKKEVTSRGEDLETDESLLAPIEDDDDDDDSEENPLCNEITQQVSRN